MNKNIVKYENIISSKATTKAELLSQVAALNGIMAHCEPSKDEMTLYENKVKDACKSLIETRRAERIDELLSMPRVEMWREYIATRGHFSGVTLSFDKGNGVYIVKENSKPSVCYDELNNEFVARETARLEAAGKTSGTDVITIASDNRFNTLYGVFFRGCYLQAVDRNLGAAACGKKAYNVIDKNGKDVHASVPSVNQLVKDLNELVSFLIPASLTDGLHMVKSDVRWIGLNAVKMTALKDGNKQKSDKECLNLLITAINTRMQGGVYDVEVKPEKKK